MILLYLLACYWWFYFHSTNHSKHFLVGEEISRARNKQNRFDPHSTDHSTLILLIILLPLYRAFYYPSTGDSTPILLMILKPKHLPNTPAGTCESYSTDDSTLILLAFYWRFYSHSTDYSTPLCTVFYSHSTSAAGIKISSRMGIEPSVECE